MIIKYTCTARACTPQMIALVSLVNKGAFLPPEALRPCSGEGFSSAVFPLPFDINSACFPLVTDPWDDMTTLLQCFPFSRIIREISYKSNWWLPSWHSLIWYYKEGKGDLILAIERKFLLCSEHWRTCLLLHLSRSQLPWESLSFLRPCLQWRSCVSLFQIRTWANLNWNL